jgi:predicted DNA binding CopG/RHH family protein
MFPNLKIDDIINGDIKNDNKVNKDIKSVYNVKHKGGKKRGRPRKEEGEKKKRVNILLEPRYIEILKYEASEKGLDLSPYIASVYIKEPLKTKYKNLK